jgi:hypothetical protein
LCPLQLNHHRGLIGAETEKQAVTPGRKLIAIGGSYDTALLGVKTAL